MLRIASARGTPGTAGALVTGADGGLYILSNQHVMLGGGARLGDRLWALPSDYEAYGPEQAVCLGRVTAGQVGQVNCGEEACFVDCALARIEAEGTFPGWLRALLTDERWPVGSAPAGTGLPVCKRGASTGLTCGILVDAAYPDYPSFDGRSWSAPNQLLVEPADPILNFAAPGDSGAALCDDHGRMLGLLWGANANGQGIACPIGPVLACLGVRLAAYRSVREGNAKQ